ncbi:MAG: ATP-binding protein [Acidimicrobiales bacterium]
MLAAVLVVGVALSVASVLLIVELDNSQLHGVDGALRLELNSVAATSRGGAFPTPLQVSSQETSFIQVLNAHGHVLASSASVEGEARIVAFTPKGQTEFRTLTNLPIGSESRYRVAALAIRTPTGRAIIYVGESLATIDHSVQALLIGLLIVDPILLLIVGATVWWLIGRALSPVEAIRSEVDEITASALDRRVPEPDVNDEIGRLAVTMNAMLGRLEDASRRQNAFVADASHELRSPLAAAQAELEISLAHFDLTIWPDSARAVLGDIERVRRIVDDLSVLARYDERGMDLVELPVDLDEIVLLECTRLQRIIPVDIDMTAVSGARVKGDAEQLGRAIRNLLDNAVRHAHHRVWVTLERMADDAVLEVVDDGPGISPEDRERIFERFVRVDESRSRSSGGSGLGLAIVCAIVSAHGGTIEVLNANPGARFILRIPSMDQED